MGSREDSFDSKIASIITSFHPTNTRNNYVKPLLPDGPVAPVCPKQGQDGPAGDWPRHLAQHPGQGHVLALAGPLVAGVAVDSGPLDTLAVRGEAAVEVMVTWQRQENTEVWDTLWKRHRAL